MSRKKPTLRRARAARRRPQRHKDVHHRHSEQRPGGFRCLGCRLDVPLKAPGTAHRNHCPHCLASRHVDRRVPGDRAAGCAGRMIPLAVFTRHDGEWMIIHECLRCRALSSNRIAGDDNALSLVRLALRPFQATKAMAGEVMRDSPP
ncbi:RNHCP domain-containing protein [Streptomyces sp. NPDC006879]|uniref:RNHCP domain-containing protein n=1 Tax=Streptomyces sp. NPDC006879 TaxID=3364767 RepID=UPI0036C2B557